MKGFLRRISPRRAVADFHQQWKQPTPHRWKILALAMAATFAVFMLIIPESHRASPQRPEVTYISTFEEGRSEAEIIASNCANQKLKDEMQALIDEKAERRRELYKALGRATFIDVDAMEAEIEAERAAQEARDREPTAEEVAMSVEEYCSRATAN